MNPKDIIHESWQPVMTLLNQEPLLTLNQDILPNCKYYPEAYDIFRVFSMPVNKIKVVILGQDPYFGPGQATGLAFAVNDTTPIPPSLNVIAKELDNEGLKESHNYDTKWQQLEHWRNQGVFLLNTALTVEAGTPGSHVAYWEYFTQRVVEFIARQNPCVWMLWGAKAQRFQVYLRDRFPVKGYTKELIEDIPASPYNNYILTAAHPAAEAYMSSGHAGFYGCNHFYFANKILYKTGKGTINW